VYAPRFVASLVANVALDVQARQRAGDQLAALEHDSIVLTGNQLEASGFLPGHPVQLLVNGIATATLIANAQGDVTSLLSTTARSVTLQSMLITETANG
jgi:hypothetical protein